MRIEYNNFSFRLNQKTIKRIRDLKGATGRTYNLLFLQMLELYEKKNNIKYNN